jgi:hypothetical protein
MDKNCPTDGARPGNGTTVSRLFWHFSIQPLGLFDGGLGFLAGFH